MNISLEIEDDDLANWVGRLLNIRPRRSDYWMRATEIPEGWQAHDYVSDKTFIIDEDFAKRAYIEGVKIYGVNWYRDHRCDATRYDIVTQMAAFGELRYG